MSADAFIAFYGVRFDLSEDELEAVEERSDPRIAAARSQKLQTHLGRLTDGESHFLLIGTKLAILGIEHDASRTISDGELEEIMRTTTIKLQSAGLRGTPELHLQLEAED